MSKTRLVSAVVAAAAAAVISCSFVNMGGVDHPQGGFCTLLSGRLYHADGRPAPHVRIEFYRLQNGADTVHLVSETDSSGAYRFTDVPIGTYSLFGQVVSGGPENFAGIFRDSLSIPPQPITLPDDTVRTGGQITGVVRLRPFQACPISIRVLDVMDPWFGHPFLVANDRTGAIGGYCSVLPEGTYRLSIKPRDLNGLDTVITIHTRANTLLDLDTINLFYNPVPLADPTMATLFEQAQRRLPGCYEGSATMSTEFPYHIVMTVDTNGHYSTYNVDTRKYPALYYFSDMDDTAKKITLTSIERYKTISAVIAVPNVSQSIGVIDLNGYLRGVRFTADYDSLIFDLYRPQIASENQSPSPPLHVALHRTDRESLPPPPFLPPTVTIDGIHYSNASDPEIPYGYDSCAYRDSATITLSTSERKNIIYQIIPGATERASSCSSTGQWFAKPWCDDFPTLAYNGPLIIRLKGFYGVVVARVTDGVHRGDVSYRPFYVH
jgi:hypothetical protein